MRLAIEFQRSHEALTKALRDIRISEEELRRTTDAIAQAILVLNPDGATIYANRVALEFSGVSRAEVGANGCRTRTAHRGDLRSLREPRQRALANAIPF